MPRTAGHVRITLARSHFRYHLFPKIYTPSRIRSHFSYHTSQRFMGHSQKKLSATSLCGSTTPPSQDLHTLSNQRPVSASTFTRICTPSLTSSRSLLPHLQGSAHPLQPAAVFCFHIYKDLRAISNKQPLSASTPLYILPKGASLAPHTFAMINKQPVSLPHLCHLRGSHFCCHIQEASTCGQEVTTATLLHVQMDLLYLTFALFTHPGRRVSVLFMENARRQRQWQ